MNRIFAITIILCLSINNFAAARPLENKELVILADSSMSAALNELVRFYSNNFLTNVNVSYMASSDIYRDIENENTNAHVFISENLYLVKRLIRQDLLQEKFVQSFARDQIVLISKKDSKFNNPKIEESEIGNTLATAISLGRKISIVDNRKSRLAGLINDYIDKLNISLSEENIYSNLTANLVTADVVENDTIGFTGRSFAIRNPQIKILSTVDDSNFDLPIYYHASTITQNNTEIGHKFLDFLKSNEAKKILAKHGL